MPLEEELLRRVLANQMRQEAHLQGLALQLAELREQLNEVRAELRGWRDW